MTAHVSSSLDVLHARAQRARLCKGFTWFTRVLLAIGFIPPGLVKGAGLPLYQHRSQRADRIFLRRASPIRLLLQLHWRLPGDRGGAVARAAGRHPGRHDVFPVDLWNLRRHPVAQLWEHRRHRWLDALGQYLPIVLGLRQAEAHCGALGRHPAPSTIWCCRESQLNGWLTRIDVTCSAKIDHLVEDRPRCVRYGQCCSFLPYAAMPPS